MRQLRVCWVLGCCHSRGCLWPCKVLCPKYGFQGHHGFRGLEGHTGAAKQGCLQEARIDPRPAEPGHFQEHVGTSYPSDLKPCTTSTPHKNGTSTMKPWLPHPSFPTPAGRRWYRSRWARQHHLPCAWNLFCCLMLRFSAKQQLPSSQHSTQGHKAGCRLTQPWEPPWTLENLQKAAAWYGVLEGSRVMIGAHSNCQAVGRKGREAAGLGSWSSSSDAASCVARFCSLQGLCTA